MSIVCTAGNWGFVEGVGHGVAKFAGISGDRRTPNTYNRALGEALLQSVNG